MNEKPKTILEEMFEEATAKFFDKFIEKSRAKIDEKRKKKAEES